MLRYQMTVVTADAGLRRAIKRVSTSTGADADFVPDVAQISAERPPHVVIFDAREHEPPKGFIAGLSPEARVIYIVDSDHLVQKVAMLEDPRITSLFCHDERFDDDEFIATATKALRGNVFGLQKYFPWGVTTYSILVKNYDEKARAIEVLLEYATLAGCRGGVRDRLQVVCDELMMNALYHAPTDAAGKELHAGKTLKELTKLEEVSTIRVQYGHSGRYFGISVRDAGGSLSRAKLLDYLKRAKAGPEIERKAGGAGLGLVSVLRSASKLIFNLEAGSSTEVIALFDMELATARGKGGARSLHIFTSTEKEERVEDRGKEARAGRPLASTAMWAVTAALLATLAVMVTLWFASRGKPKAAPPRAMIVVPTGVDVAVTLGGQPVSPNQPVTLPAGDGPVTLTIAPKP